MNHGGAGRGRVAFLCAILLLALPGGWAQAADPTDKPVLSLTGKVQHAQQFDLDQLRALPSQDLSVSFDTEHGPQQSHYTGVLLWALLDKAGGIDDATKGAVLRHVIKVTGRDGYFVLLSTGEIAPDFGAKQALVAYQRDDEAQGAGGFRLVMPGDKHGGRNVRDVVTIDVE
jgi:hypothetical protein